MLAHICTAERAARDAQRMYREIQAKIDLMTCKSPQKISPRVLLSGFAAEWLQWVEWLLFEAPEHMSEEDYREAMFSEPPRRSQECPRPRLP